MAYGRQQSTFRISDTSKKESLLLCTLFSERLQIIVSIHIHEIVIRDSSNGGIINRINYDQNNNNDNSNNNHKNQNIISNDITAGILDDKERKIIIGTSSGVISIYNCVTGMLLKSFPAISTAIQFIIYSPDKTIIVVGSSGDIYILDDRDNVVSDDYLLR